MFRRRPTPEPPIPEWKRRFDDAAELILSRQQPAWVHDRLDELGRSLAGANDTVERLAVTVERLAPEATAAELKSVLRNRERAHSAVDADDLDRRISALRQRYEAVHDIINRRETISRQMLNTTADVELLAVQALRAETMDTNPESHLDDHLQRLDSDLHALELARREVDML